MERRARMAPRMRENATIKLLRKIERLSINDISTIVGRSTSYVHRVLKREAGYENIELDDLRHSKSSNKAYGYSRRYHIEQLKKIAKKWSPFANGTAQTPPTREIELQEVEAVCWQWWGPRTNIPISDDEEGEPP